MTDHDTPMTDDHYDRLTDPGEYAADRPTHEFTLTDRVADGDSPPHERGPMRAVEFPPLTAAEAEIPTGETVADVNPNHPANAPVVRTVYESYLDSYIGRDRWREWADDDPSAFLAELRAFTNEWRLPLRTYDYPATRLVAFDPDRDGPDEVDA